MWGGGMQQLLSQGEGKWLRCLRSHFISPQDGRVRQPFQLFQRPSGLCSHVISPQASNVAELFYLALRQPGLCSHSALPEVVGVM